MTLTIALVIVGIAALIVGLMMWAIHTAAERIHAAEARLQRAMSEALAKPDDGYLASLARYRAIDLEYRQLVLDAHNNDA